jgi:hypothetical protein
MLSEKQEEALSELYFGISNFPFYGGAAGGGKTWVGCVWLHNICLDFPGTRWFIGRDSLKDTRQSVMITWSKVAKNWGFESWKFGDNCIVFDNGSNIDFLDLSFYPQKDPFFERFGSKEYTGGWIEEAGETRFEAFDVLKSRIGRHLNKEYNLTPKIFITANPKKNWLYKEFYKPFKEKKLPTTHSFIQALHTHNPYLTDDYRKSLESITDTVRRQRLLFGNFDYEDADNALCKYEKINDLFTNSFVQSGQKWITADIALTNDNFVAFVWDGLRIIDYFIIAGIDAKSLCDKLNQLENKHSVPRSNIVYNADGLGEYLKSYLPGAIGINNGMRSPFPDYFNIKDCFYYYLSDYINQNKIYVECNMSPQHKDNFITQCQMIKRHSDLGEKLRVLPKSEIKQRKSHKKFYS